MSGIEVIGAISASGAILEGGIKSISKITKKLKKCKHAPEELADLLEKLEILRLLAHDSLNELPQVDVSEGRRLVLERFNQQCLRLEILVHYTLIQADLIVKVDRIAWVREEPHVSKLVGEIYLTIGLITNFNTVVSNSQMQLLRQQMTYLFTVSLGVNQSSSFEQRLNGIEQRPGSEAILGTTERLYGISCVSKDGQVSVAGPPSSEFTARLTSQVQGLSSQSLTEVARFRHIQPLIRTRLSPPSKLCRPKCRCKCHETMTFTLPSFFRPLFGKFRATASNCWLTRGACDVPGCLRTGDSTSTVICGLPPWWGRTVIEGRYTQYSMGSIERNLRIMQAVQTRAYFYAQTGNLNELRKMYSVGQASIYDTRPRDNRSALHIAAEYEHLQVVRFLLDIGADLLREDNYGMTSDDDLAGHYFHSTTDPCESEIPTLLCIEDHLEDCEMSILHRVVLGRSSRDLGEECIEQPHLINAADSRGKTPLHWAVWCGNAEAVETLLSLDADIGAVCNIGYNFFHYCGLSDCGVELYELFRSMCNPTEESMSHLLNSQDAYGRTPWHDALADDDGRLFEIFSAHGPALSLRDSLRENMLHLATRYCTSDTLFILSKMDLGQVDIMSTDVEGETALNYALLRLRDSANWRRAPAYHEDDAEELVKLAAHMRTFEPRLPRLIYGSKEDEGGQFFDYGLKHQVGEGIKVNADFVEWVDVEKWLEDHGELSMRDGWPDDAIKCGGETEGDDEEDFNRSEDFSQYSTEVIEDDKGKDTFFDAEPNRSKI